MATKIRCWYWAVQLPWYFREPLWFSLGLPEISRVTLTGMVSVGHLYNGCCDCMSPIPHVGEINYRETSNISRTLIGNKIINHSDVVGASPVGAATTTSPFSTQQLSSMYCTKTTARRDEKHLSFGSATYIRNLTVLLSSVCVVTQLISFILTLTLCCFDTW